MQAYPSEVSEIVRAYRKDEEYKLYIRRRLNRIASSVFGPRRMIKYGPYVGVAADTIYYTVTTIAGQQTLGEEYVGTVQVSNDGMRPPFDVPCAARRVVDTLVHTCAPLLMTRLIDAYGREEEGTDEEEERSTTKSLIVWLRDNQSTLTRAHLGLFYVYAKYYHISKRLASVKYISIRPQSDLQASRWFAYLGYATLIQCVISLLYDSYRRTVKRRRTKTQHGETSHSTPLSPANHRPPYPCPLCLTPQSTVIMTQCGHLTCHDCMHRQCVASGACAECRQPIDEQRCIPIFNM